MPELAHREWEHLFEPWFANEAPCSPTVKTQVKGPESIFDEASQPLAVRREDFVRRQSPIGRATESRSVNVGAEVERLVAYVELRHHGVERSGAADRVERLPLRDATLRRLERPKPVERPLPVNVTPTPGALFADIAVNRPEGSLTPYLSATGSLRALLAFVSIVLVAVYVVHVQRSAAAAMTRAEAAERTATESQRTARDAVTAASDRAERAIAEALTHAARAERMIEVMAAPDARRIELSGRTGAPGAAGHALYSRSRGVIVSATDMPRPAEGHVFQVWATTATGSVSLGLAAPDAQGRLAAAYELPRDLAGSIRGFLVTQEHAGGSESPGAPVIANR